MRRVTLLVAASLVVPACLSTPPPLVDAIGIDGPPPRCAAGAPGAGTAWPPEGLTVHSLAIADVNGDDRDDLLVASSQPSRVYVLYGPQSGTAPAYHAVVEVGDQAELSVRGFRVDDLDADGCPELIAAGGPVTA